MLERSRPRSQNNASSFACPTFQSTQSLHRQRLTHPSLSLPLWYPSRPQSTILIPSLSTPPTQTPPPQLQPPLFSSTATAQASVSSSATSPLSPTGPNAAAPLSTPSTGSAWAAQPAPHSPSKPSAMTSQGECTKPNHSSSTLSKTGVKRWGWSA